MVMWMLLCALILLICVTSSKLLYRFGIPALLIFLVLGMLFGSDGVVGIYFDNFALSRDICSIGLVFIMFYGGMGTNWKMAKPVAVPAICMSTLGVVVTAGLTGLFCYFVLRMSLLEGLLVGAVVSSTDAASVFSILRSRKLNLKGGLASLLEVESGSNDPFAYMLTVTVLSFMNGGGGEPVWWMLIKQVAFGLLIGFALAKVSAFFLRRVHFEMEGLYTICVMAIAILSYALSEWLGGNGYLSVYLVGIVLGNSRFPCKQSVLHFFDGISWLMQMLLFFTLGLLAFPSNLPAVALAGMGVSVFLILIARPAATFGILSWFKVPLRQQLLVSWVGLRGAASIVFAIYAVTYQVALKNDIFHIVFFVALFSVAVQGTLIPLVARKLQLVDTESTVLKTFNDYREEMGGKLVELPVEADNVWAGKSLMEADIPDEILVVMIRRGENVIVPKGSTVIEAGDVMVLSGANIEEALAKARETA